MALKIWVNEEEWFSAGFCGGVWSSALIPTSGGKKRHIPDAPFH